MFIIDITKTHRDLPVCIVIDNYSIHNDLETAIIAGITKLNNKT